MQEVDDMTWAEYCLRRRGKERRDLRELENIRLLSYNMLLINWQNPKKKPPTIDAYWPLHKSDNKQASVNDKMIERFKEATVQYLKDKNNG